MSALPPPIPDRLRHGRGQRHARRRLFLLACLPCLALALPMWRIEAVEINDCPGLPPAARTSLAGLEHSSPFLVDLDWVRRQVEVWPAVAAVDVRFRLPGTLHVHARPATAAASVTVGRGWHGVADNGSLTGPQARPIAPRLIGFALDSGELRRGLLVAHRLQHATGGTIESVRQIMPEDLEVTLRLGDDPANTVTVHVRAQPTLAEEHWCALLDSAGPHSSTADLRWDNRLVLGVTL